MSGDEVTAIPVKLLKAGDELKIDTLPFAVRVKTFWKNSDPSFRAPMMQNALPLTTNGLARSFDFRQLPDVKTMDERNVPTAVIELLGPNGSLGNWVVSDWAGDDALVEAIRKDYAAQMGAAMAQKITSELVRPQSVAVNGKSFTFVLRPTRIYQPFSLTLLKATHTTYPGTDIPKDFRSRVRIENAATGEKREVEISMNHPLRYGGLTFYQYQMDAGQVAAAGRTHAVLRAAGGAQSQLVDALHRMRDGGRGAGDSIHVSPRRLCFKEEMSVSIPRFKMKKLFQKWTPPALLLVMAAWFFGQLQTPKDKDFAFTEFGQLPVVFNGRLKPMDSVARNSLLEIREKQTLNTEPWKDWNQHPKIIPATEWLANVMMNPAVADDWPVFRVDNPDLISLLKLPERDPAKKSDGKHYSWNQIQPLFDTLEKENDRVQKIEAASRTAYENAIAKLHERLMLYAQLKNTIQPADAQDWPAELAAFEKLIPAGVAAAKAQQAGQEFDQTNFNMFAADISRFQFMAGLEPPLVLPPDGGRWRRMGDALLDAPRGVPVDDFVRNYAKMAGALAATSRTNSTPPSPTCARNWCRPGQSARQGARRGFLQPDGAVLQRDGHLRPRRPARGVFLVQFVRNPAALGRCGSSASRLPSTPPAWFIAWCSKAGRR